MTETTDRLRAAVIDPSGFSLPYDSMLCNALVDRAAELGPPIDVSLLTTDDRRSDAWSLPDPEFDYRPHYYRWTARSTLPEPARMVFKASEHVLDQARLVGARAYDLYHIQWAPIAAVDWLVFRLLRLSAPVVLTAHNIMPHEATAFDTVSRKLLYRSVDHLIVHTSPSKERLMRQFDIPGDNISVIPHGNFSYMETFDIDVGALPARVRDLEHRPTMLAFGLVREYKRVDVAIRALAVVQETVPEAALLVAGDARMDMSTYHELAADLGLADDVVFLTEYIPDELVPSVFEVADVSVFPYEDIDQSGAALLAATLGTPVVASDIAGFKDILISGETGLLVDGSPTDLAKAVSRVLSDPELRDRLGSAVAERAHSEFGWEAIAEQTLDVYGDMGP